MAEAPHQEFTRERIVNLLKLFIENSKIKKPLQRGSGEHDAKIDSAENDCLHLFARDYKYSIISNKGGELCGHYPEKIVILEYKRSSEEGQTKMNEEVECLYDLSRLRELFAASRFGRCRARFVVPVILYEGKHVCRSSTLSRGIEMYGRIGIDYFWSGGEKLPTGEEDGESASSKMRGHDIELLKSLSVKYIIDLMVENKKVKFGMYITSSEKADRQNRYQDFELLSLPYPGCEFFKDYKMKGYFAEGLQFDWNQSFVDADLQIPEMLSTQLEIDWRDYKTWDLIKLTQNYLKMLLHIIREGNEGVLVHCISGWDRTPLFISLLRLSMWADGLIHTSLSAMEITYLTVAYDWMLFGHSLADRLFKGEEIFFFCFFFLKYINSQEFSICKEAEPSASQSSGDISGSNRNSRHQSSTSLSVKYNSLPESTCLVNENSLERSDSSIMTPLSLDEIPSVDQTESGSIEFSIPDSETEVSSQSWQSGHFDSIANTTDQSETSNSHQEVASDRESRLRQVRAEFSNIYSHVIGFDLNPESGTSAFGFIQSVFSKLGF